MSDSPFAAQPGVSMSTVEAPAPVTPPGGNAKGLTIPDVGGGSQQPPQRDRIGSFNRGVVQQPQHQRQTIVEMVPEDPSDPYSGLVDRSTIGNAGAELARAEPTGIDAEVEAFTRQQEAEANGEPEEVEAQLLEDDPRLQSDPRFKTWREAHERLTALEQSDALPDELANKFRSIKLGNGQVAKYTVKELERSFLRERDYHGKLRELRAHEEAVNRRAAGVQNVIDALSSGDPNRFLQMMQYLQAFPTFDLAAKMYGRQLKAERAMTDEQRQLLYAYRASEAEKYRLQVELNAKRALEAQQAQQQPTVDVSMYENQLAQMLPIAAQRMEAGGRPYVDSPLAKALFEANWTDIVVRDFKGELTTDMVQEVMEATMQQVNDHYLAAGRIPDPKPAAATQVPPVGRVSPQPSAAMPGNQARPNGRLPARARASEINFINRPAGR